MLYCKPPNISPRLIFAHKHFLIQGPYIQGSDFYCTWTIKRYCNKVFIVSYKQENSEQFDYYSKHSGRFFFGGGRLIQYLEMTQCTIITQIYGHSCVFKNTKLCWQNFIKLKKTSEVGSDFIP